MVPLYSALVGKTNSLLWEAQQEEAFITSKKSLVSATTPSFPAPDVHLFLSKDANNVTVGTVLSRSMTVLHTLFIFSAGNSTQPKKNCSTFDCEPRLSYRRLTLPSPLGYSFHHQHRPPAFSRIQDAWSARQRCHLSSISEYSCTIRHISGKKNPVADALSQIETDAVYTNIDYCVLADAQRKDPRTPAYKTSITNLQWCDVSYKQEGNMILCDISTGQPRPFILACLHRRVFDLIHGLSHPSGRSTAKLLKQKFIWHRIASDTKCWARVCISCHQSNVTRHIKSGIGD